MSPAASRVVDRCPAAVAAVAGAVAGAGVSPAEDSPAQPAVRAARTTVTASQCLAVTGSLCMRLVEPSLVSSRHDRLYLTWQNRNTYDCRLSNRQQGKRCLMRH